MADQTNGAAGYDGDAGPWFMWIGLIAMVIIAGAIVCGLIRLWPSDDCLARRTSCDGSTAAVQAEIQKVKDAQVARAEISKALDAAAMAVARSAAGKEREDAQKIFDGKQIELKNAEDKVRDLVTKRDAAIGKWTELSGSLDGDTFERRVLIIMFLLGAMGGVFHGLYSWVVHAGVGNLKTSWLPWLLVRPGVGGLLALIIYLVLRGGLVSPLPAAGDVAQPFNFYGFAALAAMSGLFTHQASEKLKEVFSVVFKPAQLERTARGPMIRKVVPETLSPAVLAAGGATLSIEGEGFTDKSVVKVGSNANAEIIKQTATTLEVRLPKIDGQKEGVALEIAVEEPTLKPRSEPAKLAVRTAPAAISTTDPQAIDRAVLTGEARKDVPVSATGSGLIAVAKAFINTTEVKVSDVTDAGFKFVLPSTLPSPATTDKSLPLKLQDKADKDLLIFPLPLK